MADIGSLVSIAVRWQNQWTIYYEPRSGPPEFVMSIFLRVVLFCIAVILDLSRFINISAMCIKCKMSENIKSHVHAV